MPPVMSDKEMEEIAKDVVISVRLLVNYLNASRSSLNDFLTKYVSIST